MEEKERREEVDGTSVLLEKGVSKWLLYGTYTYALIVIITSLFTQSYIFTSIIGVLIAFYSGKKCVYWALDIKKSVNFAYGFGFFLSLLGLLSYYYYYRYVKRGGNGYDGGKA